MENLLVLMKSVIDSWMSPSTMAIVMDMSIGIMCGAGLFLLLIPFLKEYPVSPASGSKSDIPKNVKRWQKKTRKKTAAGKGCRDGGKDREETKTPSQLKKSVTKQLVQDFIPQPFWSPNQNMEYLQLSQLFSYLKVLEDLMQHNFKRLFWGISSIFSESVVASAQVFRRPPLAKLKSVRFTDARGPAKAPSQAKETPQSSRYQPLHHQLVTPKLIGEKQVQEKKILPSSTLKQTPPCFKSRACELSYPTESRIQSSLPIESLSQKHGLHSQYTKGYEDQKPIRTPIGILPRSILPTKPTRSASIHPEHCQILQHHEEPQNIHKTTNVGEQQGSPNRFLPSRKLTQLQGHFPANRDHYSMSRPQLSQPDQPSILNSKNYKCSRMMGSVPTGLPLKRDTAKGNVYNTIKKFLGLGAKPVPCTSSSSPEEGLTPMNPALRTDKLSCMSPGELHSMLDTKTEKRVAPNITAFPVKRRTGPYMQILEAKDLASPGDPAPNLPQVVYPSSPICDPKAEFYSKAARVLEKLHHQDPGGTLVDCLSTARLQRAGSIPAEVRETQRAPPPAASHRASKAYTDPLLRYLSFLRPASYFQAANPYQSRTIRGIGKGSPQPNTNPKMAKHVPQKSFQEVGSGHHPQIVAMVRPGERVPPSAAKQTKTAEVKEEPPCTLKVSLGSSEIHSSQDIDISPGVFGSLQSNRSPVHLQTPTPQHSQDATQKTQGYSKMILSSDKQPDALPVRHHPDGLSTVYSAEVCLPSQNSLPIFQNTCQNPKTSQGLCDVSMRRPERVDTQDNRVLKDKIKMKGLKGVQPHEERQSTIRSRAISQGESLGRVRPYILSSTQLKDTTKTQIAGKGEATCKSSWKNTTRNAVQERNLSTNYTRQGYSLGNDRPPAAPEKTQEVLKKKKVICSMISELQSLVNALSQIVKNTERDTSKADMCKGESLTSQLGSMSHTSEGLCNTHHSRAASRRSCGRASPEMHNYPFTYRGTRDKLLTGTEVQKVCDQHWNKDKRETGFDQLHMSKGKELPCGYRGIGDKQASRLSDKRDLDPGKIITDIVMDHCPHRSSKGYKQSFGYREIEDEQQSGVDFDPHQSRPNQNRSGSRWLRPSLLSHTRIF
ncbi:spermatogenesis-associated protein 31E1-like [Apodemus sylvaticus]|uniref:spermatogenesis-associated protein 31E1-like n=1 Tax=Apodemus sylvaticus TaxID=10129 RepID=UPI0022431CEF|nr:spermatogenesis-associated protein 31E1-like [Apodemus sylvaticus]